MNDELEYDIPSDEALMLTEHLFKLKNRLGIPDEVTVDDLNETIWSFMMEIMRVFKIGYPQDYQDWIAAIEFDLLYERPIKEALSKGGYTPLSYPEFFFKLVKTFFPKLKINDKKFTRGIIKHMPEFKRTNYGI